jgi:hypothetical protein
MMRQSEEKCTYIPAGVDFRGSFFRIQIWPGERARPVKRRRWRYEDMRSGWSGSSRRKKAARITLVFVAQGDAGQSFAFDPVVGAVADGGELALLGGGDFIQEFAGMGGDAIGGRDLRLGVEESLQGIDSDQLGVEFGVGG